MNVKACCIFLLSTSLLLPFFFCFDAFYSSPDQKTLGTLNPALVTGSSTLAAIGFSCQGIWRHQQWMGRLLQQAPCPGSGLHWTPQGPSSWKVGPLPAPWHPARPWRRGNRCWHGAERWPLLGGSTAWHQCRGEGAHPPPHPHRRGVPGAGRDLRLESHPLETWPFLLPEPRHRRHSR